MSFYEVCKILIGTEGFHSSGVPHLETTGINFYTQENPGAVEFDHNAVFEREDKYHDIVGFYHTHPSGLNRMSSVDIQTMIQWVNCLGKSLICAIETEEQLNAWLFYKDDGKVIYRQVIANTNNDVNYSFWLERPANFWDPADFLLEAGFFDDEEEGEDYFGDMTKDLQKALDNQEKILQGIGGLADLLKRILLVIGSKNEQK